LGYTYRRGSISMRVGTGLPTKKQLLALHRDKCGLQSRILSKFEPNALMSYVGFTYPLFPELVINIILCW
jgi:hypothetical protein